MPYVLAKIVLNNDPFVFLRVDIEFFASLLVFKPNLIEVVRRTIEAAAGLDTALCLIVRQLVRRHLVGVVHAAHNDGLVRIAFQEIDEHFLADPRDVDHAPVLVRPRD